MKKRSYSNPNVMAAAHAAKLAAREETERRIDEVRNEIKRDFLKRCIIVYSLVLRDEFGFGKARLERFLTGVQKQSDYLDDGVISLDDIVNVLFDETGLDLREEKK